MFSKALAGLAIVLVVASSARAEHKIIGETKLPEYAFCSLRIDSKAAVSWKVVPAPVRKQVIDRQFVFSGKPGIVYTVYATIIDFKAESFEEAEVEVTFGKEPGPGPSPVPPGPSPPVPPAPSGLVKDFKDAAVADGWAKTKLVDMADWFLACGDLAIKGGTVGEFQEATQNAQRTAIGPLPPAIKAIVKREYKELDALIPVNDTAVAMTLNQRTGAQAFFKRLAKAAEDAAK